MELNVSNIQHFSVGDGDGIRTTVFLKGCNLHCPWCHNPETISSEEQTLHYENIGKTETCGKKMSVSEIVAEVLQDKEFYDESNGGVTISGGEAMLQPDGVLLLAKALKEQGVSVFIDTAGNVPYVQFEKVNPYVDGYLFDYKTDSDEKFREVVGGNLQLVRENIEHLIKAGKEVHIRIPLIPGFNTDQASIQNICKSLQKLGVTIVDLLPFHKMGSGKYKALGMAYSYENVELLTKEEIENIKCEFHNYFKTNVEH